ncbi:MAG: hypothetical protein J7556_09370 [Acidovorax sp.]|nr:hypothetical protein [Acidovorax sp.]
MDIAEPLFTVALRDYPEDLPAKDRSVAEARYAKELERQFGSPGQVAAALDTMHSLEESPPEVVSPSELALLKHWGKASTAARQAGFRDLGDTEAAYFDVQLA